LSFLSSSKERHIRALRERSQQAVVTLRQAQRDEVHGAMTTRVSSFDKPWMTRLFDELAPT